MIRWESIICQRNEQRLGAQIRYFLPPKKVALPTYFQQSFNEGMKNGRMVAKKMNIVFVLF